MPASFEAFDDNGVKRIRSLGSTLYNGCCCASCWEGIPQFHVELTISENAVEQTRHFFPINQSALNCTNYGTATESFNEGNIQLEYYTESNGFGYIRLIFDDGFSFVGQSIWTAFEFSKGCLVDGQGACNIIVNIECGNIDCTLVIDKSPCFDLSFGSGSFDSSKNTLFFDLSSISDMAYPQYIVVLTRSGFTWSWSETPFSITITWDAAHSVYVLTVQENSLVIWKGYRSANTPTGLYTTACSIEMQSETYQLTVYPTGECHEFAEYCECAFAYNAIGSIEVCNDSFVIPIYDAGQPICSYSGSSGVFSCTLTCSGAIWTLDITKNSNPYLIGNKYSAGCPSTGNWVMKNLSCVDAPDFITIYLSEGF